MSERAQQAETPFIRGVIPRIDEERSDVATPGTIKGALSDATVEGRYDRLIERTSLSESLKLRSSLVPEELRRGSDRLTLFEGTTAEETFPNEIDLDTPGEIEESSFLPILQSFGPRGAGA
jgi:hypothetical protein